MNCNCKRANELTKCLGALTIGTISADTDVYVYFQDTATGRIDREEASSDGAGSLSLTPSIKFMPDRDYEVWVTTRTAELTDYEQVTASGDTEARDCYILRFVKSYSGQLVNMDQTITV